ncbi:DUF4105 domain-containing protein [Sulfurimonas sp.]|uniref:Lnb N-terminal periplasmic domain-containing protein n=1 Tax=Sulfurimonas sp. TaxID=2022749 RepID=UPI002AAF18A3|nr:DUF4105 domain-containing protein [Sulfurimonas sp.]
MPKNKSELASKDFFLADNGKTDALAELEATIYSLYNEQHFDDNSTACLFPARKHWLVKELKMKGLPKVNCEEFDYLMEQMSPDSVSLIFPFTQGSSPSSMFGHTFLRIDSKIKPKMLSYAFNYASESNDEDNHLEYMYKGFFGGYKGFYSLMPYYAKIKEYRDLEERDIWEYDLNFTKEETQQMIRHIWEVEINHSWYYFFTKNCSYKMLWIMESARPGLNLRKYFNYHVIPLETIRAVIDEGLVNKHHYRPARNTKLIAYESRLNSEDIKNVFNLSGDNLEPKEYLKDSDSNVQTKRFVLEASSEFVEYDYLKKDINESQYKSKIYKILKARASLGEGEHIEIIIPIDPVLSHRSFRVTAEIGTRNSKAISFIGVRPANHAIEDFDLGYSTGAQVEFMNLLFSYSKDDFNIEKATIVSVAALSPKSEFFKPNSYRFSFGLDRKFLSEGTEITANYSLGATWGNHYGYVYLLGDVLLYTDDFLTLGLGGIAGAVLYQGKDFKTNIEVNQRLYHTGENQLLFSFSQHYRSSQNTAISLSYEYIEKYKTDWNTFKLSLNYFF